jgi:hypothetical protein
VTGDYKLPWTGGGGPGGDCRIDPRCFHYGAEPRDWRYPGRPPNAEERKRAARMFPQAVPQSWHEAACLCGPCQQRRARGGRP